MPVKQVNYSVSRRRTLRGLHGTLLPPGQARAVCGVRCAWCAAGPGPGAGLTAEVLAESVATLLTGPEGPAVRARTRQAVRTAGAGGAVRAADLLEAWAAVRPALPAAG